MGYQQTEWKDHVLDERTGQIIQQGTPVNAENLNNIEQGIVQNTEQINNILKMLESLTKGGGAE